MSNLCFDLLGQSCEEFCLRHGKTDNKKRATCFPLLPQNELNSDVARFIDCKTVGFFLKTSKEIGKAWRKSLARAKRASLTCP